MRVRELYRISQRQRRENIYNRIIYTKVMTMKIKSKDITRYNRTSRIHHKMGHYKFVDKIKGYGRNTFFGRRILNRMKNERNSFSFHKRNKSKILTLKEACILMKSRC